MKLVRAAFGAVLACASGTVSAQSLTTDQIRAALSRVDGEFIRQNAATGRDWPSYGLNHAENRFSPLRGVTTENVSQLGLAWSYDLGSKRGVQATPVVVSGVMYVTASWSVVHAVNARTG